MINKFLKTIISFCIFFLLTTISSYAQNSDNEVVDIKIYFHYDKAEIDPTYMDNSKILHIVDSLLKNNSYISTIRQIKVKAQSSPEGKVEYNSRLSERRRVSLKKFFESNYPNIDPSLWSFEAVAENWELFHENLKHDKNIPNRDRVLAISSSDREADAKEWLLKTMNDGESWQYIKEHILPLHRFGASILFIPMVYPQIDKPYMVRTIDNIISPLSPIETAIYEPITEDDFRFLFALKTNLVLDALSVVNLGVEIPIGERFSVVGEVVYPWWRSWPANYTMQIESYHAELKYWLGDRSKREQLQGWSVGAYGGWGRYDIQPFTEKGVQGYFIDYGAEVGYAHSIARNLNLEYTIGLGYISTKYDKYKMAYNTDEFGDIKVIPFPWQNNRLRSILPTRCGVSLVWTIKKR